MCLVSKAYNTTIQCCVLAIDVLRKRFVVTYPSEAHNTYKTLSYIYRHENTFSLCSGGPQIQTGHGLDHL